VTFEGHFGDLLTVVNLCAQPTRDLLAIAKFLVIVFHPLTDQSHHVLTTIDEQGSRIRSVRVIFFEGYVRTLTYSILAYANKNRIHCNYNAVV